MRQRGLNPSASSLVVREALVQIGTQARRNLQRKRAFHAACAEQLEKTVYVGIATLFETFAPEIRELARSHGGGDAF